MTGINVASEIEISNGYPSHTFHNCIDSFKEPEGDWDHCPCCDLQPKVWEFDNGRSTACGCWTSKYDHFSINAECIMSVVKRTDSFAQYDRDALRTNWNDWCRTGAINFVHAQHRTDDRW